MILANIPAVLIGDRIADRLPMRAIRITAAVVFAILGVLTLAGSAGKNETVAQRREAGKPRLITSCRRALLGGRLRADGTRVEPEAVRLSEFGYNARKLSLPKLVISGL